MIAWTGKALALLIYTLIFAELFMRVMNPQPLMPRYVTEGSGGIRGNIPGSVYRHRTPEIDVEYRINSQGMRSDIEHSPKKPANTYRVVLLGDSFFMGYEVDLKDSLAWLTQQRLRERGIDAEAINLAVSGFGTAEHLIALRERGRQFDPDLIVMQWHSGDMADNRRSALFTVKDDSLQQKNTTYLPGIGTRDTLMKIPGYTWLIANSHFYSAVRETAASIVKDLLTRRNQDNQNDTSDKKGAARKASLLDKALIRAVASESSAMGADFILLDIPRKPADGVVRSTFASFDEAYIEEFDHVSPVDVFESALIDDNKLHFEQGHGHWTPLGNSLVADELVTSIMALLQKAK